MLSLITPVHEYSISLLLIVSELFIKAGKHFIAKQLFAASLHVLILGIVTATWSING
jgi:hypothetical protein